MLVGQIQYPTQQPCLAFRTQVYTCPILHGPSEEPDIGTTTIKRMHQPDPTITQPRRETCLPDNVIDSDLRGPGYVRHFSPPTLPRTATSNQREQEDFYDQALSTSPSSSPREWIVTFREMEQEIKYLAARLATCTSTGLRTKT